jgi:hypothetical protein
LDDRLHAHRLELTETFRRRLSAAVEVVRDAMEIRQAWFLDWNRPDMKRRLPRDTGMKNLPLLKVRTIDTLAKAVRQCK